jgi:hypothetical protein
MRSPCKGNRACMDAACARGALRLRLQHRAYRRRVRRHQRGHWRSSDPLPTDCVRIRKGHPHDVPGLWSGRVHPRANSFWRWARSSTVITSTSASRARRKTGSSITRTTVGRARRQSPSKVSRTAPELGRGSSTSSNSRPALSTRRSELCRRLLGWPASASGRLCHGDGGHEWGRPPPEGVHVDYPRLPSSIS